MLESAYQARLIKTLEHMFPGIMVLKMNPQHNQGILDLLLLWGKNWGSLEVKGSASANVQPNQEFFVRHLDDMSFAAFIHPDNEAEVLSALQQAFAP